VIGSWAEEFLVNRKPGNGKGGHEGASGGGRIGRTGVVQTSVGVEGGERISRRPEAQSFLVFYQNDPGGESSGERRGTWGGGERAVLVPVP